MAVGNRPDELEQMVNLVFAHSGLVSKLSNLEIEPREKRGPRRIVRQARWKGLLAVAGERLVFSCTTTLGVVLSFETVGSSIGGCCERKMILLSGERWSTSAKLQKF